MLSNGRILLAVWVVAGAAVLLPSQQQPPSSDPAALVAEAEKRCEAEDVEGAILLLWQAIAESGRADGALEPAAAAARLLLARHDPLHEHWLRANAMVAKQQATLATMYRRKKWYGTAARRLAAAESCDLQVSQKERIAFDKVRAEIAASPAAAAKDPGKQLNPVFDRGNTFHVDGSWRLVDGAFLESAAHDGTNVLDTWLTRTQHEDCEIVVEMHPADARKDRNAGLIFGAVDRNHYFCARFGAFVRNKFDSIEIYQVKGKTEKRLAEISTRNNGRVPETHRLILHIRGAHLRFQVDDRPPLEADAEGPVRGQLGLCVGVTGFESCPIQFRRFDVGPLPGEHATAEQLEAERQSKILGEVVDAIDRAKVELANKELESAAARLRRARFWLRSLTSSERRLELAQSIEASIRKADRQHKRRYVADQQCAAGLVALADEYALGGMPRAASAVVARATRFTPLTLTEREAAAQSAVDAWKAAHVTELPAGKEPSIESGAALRKWFTEGRRLDAQSPIGWVVAGATARVVDLNRGQISAWMPRDGLPPLAKAAIAVRLPSVGAAAGFCFDVAGSHDFAVARLERSESGLVLGVQRWRDRKWTPLGSELIELPAGKAGGWFELELEAAAKGVVIRAAGETVEVDRALVGAFVGRYGLVATNAGESAATLEVAAFRFTK